MKAIVSPCIPIIIVQQCDGRRPKCLACQRKVTECVYDQEAKEANKVAGLKRQNLALAEQLATHRNLINSFREGRDTEAQAMLGHLRDGMDLDTIVNTTLTTSPEATSFPLIHREFRDRHHSFATATTDTHEADTFSTFESGGSSEFSDLAKENSIFAESLVEPGSETRRLALNLHPRGNSETHLFQMMIPQVRS